MIKLRLAIGAAVASLVLLSTGSVAHAADPIEPVATPTPTPSIAPDDATLTGDDPSGTGQAPDTNGILPNTGGASIYVLLAAGLLLVVGGSVVYSGRRRPRYTY